MEWIKYSLVYTAENSIRNRIGRPIRFEIRLERKKRFAGPYLFTCFIAHRKLGSPLQ